MGLPFSDGRLFLYEEHYDRLFFYDCNFVEGEVF